MALQVNKMRAGTFIITLHWAGRLRVILPRKNNLYVVMFASWPVKNGTNDGIITH